MSEIAEREEALRDRELRHRGLLRAIVDTAHALAALVAEERTERYAIHRERRELAQLRGERWRRPVRPEDGLIERVREHVERGVRQGLDLRDRARARLGVDEDM